jgi:DNA repair protein RadD
MDMQLPAPRINLRPYQKRLIDELRQAYRDEMNACLVLPTGGGKTVISAGLAQSSQDRNRKVWFAVHKDFLLSQTAGTFRDMGVGHGYIAAGQPNGLHPTMVCMIPTLHARMHKIVERPDVILWDEAHHTASKSWREVWEWAGPDCFHLGLTATPERLDGRGLRPEFPGAPGFERLILGPTTAELMSYGNLCRYRAFAPSHPDLTGVGTVAGEYNQKHLKKAVRKSVITGDVVKHYQQIAPGKRGIYFCVGVQYSQELAAEFNAAGIPAEHMDGRHSLEERVAAARRFALGETKILTNCALFSEGYDLAAQAGMDVTVEVCGLVRPTLSMALHIQQMGRALRPKPFPAMIIDHAGNIAAHGLPDTDRDWTLSGRRKRAPADASAVKTCPACFAVLPTSASVCHCGHVFTVDSKGHNAIEHVAGTLGEIDTAEYNRRKRSWSTIVGQCKSLEDFQKAGKYLGYQRGWAWHAFKEFCAQGYVSRRGRF